ALSRYPFLHSQRCHVGYLLDPSVFRYNSLVRLHAFLLALLTLLPTLAAAQPALSVQEALLRAKPAVALVVSEVAGDVVVRCGDGAETKVTPPPFRETGTAWFI